MNKYFLLILFTWLVCSPFSSYASQPATSDAGCCIETVVGNKIYLKPTTIYVAKNGIFINVRGELHAITQLSMDTKGVYFDAREAGLPDWVVGDCPKCGDVTIFGICMNSACPLKQKD